MGGPQPIGGCAHAVLRVRPCGCRRSGLRTGQPLPGRGRGIGASARGRALSESRRHGARLRTAACGAPAHEVATLAVDAWSITGSRFEGSETALFQAGLFPYLLYLYFLQREEVKCPPLANFGARFLLVFVAATIPAGIVSKVVYHDILANVDFLHGPAESLLTLSNFLLALGFARALAAPEEYVRGRAAAAEPSPWGTVGAFVATSVVVCLALVGAAPLVGEAIAAGGAARHAEPANALSIPTWAIHVGSILEFAVATRLIWRWADVSGNQAWKGLSWGLLPFFPSGMSAITFHVFYNAPALNLLVPFQAAMTLVGNCTCAFATWRILREGQRLQRQGAAAVAPPSPAGGAAPAKSGALAEPLDETMFAVKVAALSALLGFALKYGELLVDLPFEPSYAAAFSCLLTPSVLLVFLIPNTRPPPGGTAPASDVADGADVGSAVQQSLSMDRVKEFGAAGTVAYVLVELVFWAVALPSAVVWYRYAEGDWLDITDAADKAKLLGAGTVFVSAVRLLVPVRLAAALALAPAVRTGMARLGISGVEQEDDNSKTQ